MKCKSCGSEISPDLKECPNCGEPIDNKKQENYDFEWDLEDFRKPKKKPSMAIDWDAGKIFNHESGLVYDQGTNKWVKSKEKNTLFDFDVKREDYKELLSKEKKSLKKSTFDFNLESESEFELPSASQMSTVDLTFDDDADNDAVNAGTSDGIAKDTDAGMTYAKGTKSKSENSQKKQAEERETHAKESAETEAVKEDIDTSDEKSGINGKLEFSGFKKLLEAEEKSNENIGRIDFLSDAEIEKAKNVEAKAEVLRYAPDISFRSLEDEYDTYCEENGIEHFVDEAKKEVQIKINEPSGTKVTVKTQEINLAKLAESGDVNTQEVDLGKLRQDPKNVQVSVEVNATRGNASVEVTRLHDGATMVKTVDEASKHERMYLNTDMRIDPDSAGNIEMAADAGEKFKTQDGASVAETDDVSSAVNEDNIEQQKEEIERENEQRNSEKELSREEFWNTKPSEENRMTITDIFGPEARNILNNVDLTDSLEEESDDEGQEMNDTAGINEAGVNEAEEIPAEKSHKNLKKALKNKKQKPFIMDIKPEDIALSDEQSSDLTSDAGDELIDDIPDFDMNLDETEDGGEVSYNADLTEAFASLDEFEEEDSAELNQGANNYEINHIYKTKKLKIVPEPAKSSESDFAAKEKTFEENDEADKSKQKSVDDKWYNLDETEFDPFDLDSDDILSDNDTRSDDDTQRVDDTHETEDGFEFIFDDIKTDIENDKKPKIVADNIDSAVVSKKLFDEDEENALNDDFTEVEENHIPRSAKSKAIEKKAQEIEKTEKPKSFKERLMGGKNKNKEDQESKKNDKDDDSHLSSGGGASLGNLSDSASDTDSGMPGADLFADLSGAATIAAPNKMKMHKSSKPRTIQKNRNSSYDAEYKGMNKPTKVIIGILSTLLVVEFTVFGVKIFAPESQGAVFIDRVQAQVIDVFDSSDN